MLYDYVIIHRQKAPLEADESPAEIFSITTTDKIYSRRKPDRLSLLIRKPAHLV